jgi:hypothetical protein
MVLLMKGVAEEDYEDNMQGRPAINKLKKLGEVEGFMCQVGAVKNTVCQSGGLHVSGGCCEKTQCAKVEGFMCQVGAVKKHSVSK